MKIKFRNISVAELIKNYHNDGEEGVYGYDNKLNIRPKYRINSRYYKNDKKYSVLKLFTKKLLKMLKYYK